MTCLPGKYLEESSLNIDFICPIQKVFLKDVNTYIDYKMYIVPSSTAYGLSEKLASILSADISEVERKRFPDNEMYVRVKEDISGQDVMVIGNTKNDSDLIEYLLLLNAVREEDPKSLTAIIPYFGYARQHMRYHSGEPISSKVFTEAISEYADRIISVELHNDQTIKYSKVPFINIKIMNPIYQYFKNGDIDYIISPDDGGYERARNLANKLGVESYYINKKRINSNTVQMDLPNVNYKNKNVLLVDDIISTGGTIIRASQMLKDRGVNQIGVCAVHGIFAGNSDKKISDIATNLIVTDTIESKYSKITIAGEIASALLNKIRA